MIKAIRSLSNKNGNGCENIAKKNEYAFFQTSARLFRLAQFVKCGRLFVDLDSKRLYPASKEEKRIRSRVFKSCMKRRIRRFHVVKWTSTKWAKKRNARVELLFCSALHQLYLHVVVVAVAVVAYGP